jgi:hypothetical protein
MMKSTETPFPPQTVPVLSVVAPSFSSTATIRPVRPVDADTSVNRDEYHHQEESGNEYTSKHPSRAGERFTAERDGSRNSMS